MPTRPANRFMPTLRRVVLAGTASERTDGQLLGAFVADRDADAFAGLVRRHGPMVLGVCRRVTGDHTTADDAFQAVFLVLARRAAAIQPREQVGNWLFGVAYRTAMKARAVQARRRSREKQVEVMPEPPVSSPEAWSDLQPVIDEELARLPDKLRFPIVLCDLEGRPQREVAKHLGVPAATLATRLASARRTLAERLTRRGVTLSGGALAGLLSAHGTAAAVPHSLAYGLAQAAEAIAGGNIVTSLVSPHAIQLSEGVIRMMFLTKLKTVAVAVLTALTLSGGLGLGLVPAIAGDDTGPASTGKTAAASSTVGNPPIQSQAQEFKVVIAERDVDLKADDETFLRRLTLDLRGEMPTPVEMWFFVADQDKEKRAKVISWLVDEETIVAQLAKKLGVSQDKIRVSRLKASQEGKTVTLVTVDSDAVKKEQQPKMYSLTRRQRIVADSSKAAEVTYGLRSVADGENVHLWDIDEVQSGDKVRWGIWDANTGKPVENATKSGRRKTDGGVDLNAAEFTAREEFVLFDKDKPENKSVVKDFAVDVNLAQISPTVSNDSYWVDFASDIVVVSLDMGSDSEFLKRVLLDARGTAPTVLEEKYFSEDKDPKKKEKLLETLLKDPAVAKKLGDDWKKKMLESSSSITQMPAMGGLRIIDSNRWTVIPASVEPRTPQAPADPAKPSVQWRVIPAAPKAAQPPADPTKPTVEVHVVPAAPRAPQPPADPTKPTVEVHVVPAPKAPQPPAVPARQTVEVQVIPVVPNAAKMPVRQSSRLEKLVDELLSSKKSDAEMLEAVTLATVGRLPTDAEKRLTLGLMTKATDRKGAWVEVAKALATTDEGKK